MPVKTEDIEIKLLLEAIFRKYHYDFRGYSMASLKRRLSQAKEHFACQSFSLLQDRILHDPSVLPELLSYLTVQVSELFRDPDYFRAIRENVVPHLRTYPSLKVWVAGCSAGEELYSLAILFREEGLEDRTLFYGTDINPNADAGRKRVSIRLIGFHCLPKTTVDRAENHPFRITTLPPMAPPC